MVKMVTMVKMSVTLALATAVRIPEATDDKEQG